MADSAERVLVGILNCSHGVIYRSLSDELSEWLRDEDTTAANVQDAPPNGVGGQCQHSAVCLVGQPTGCRPLHSLNDNALSVPVINYQVAGFKWHGANVALTLRLSGAGTVASDCKQNSNRGIHGTQFVMRVVPGAGE